MKVHELKVNEDKFSKYLDKESWSIRNDDRDFRIGDICVFKAFVVNES